MRRCSTRWVSNAASSCRRACYGEDNRRTIDAVRALGIERARGVVMVGADIAEAELAAIARRRYPCDALHHDGEGRPTLDQLPEVAARVAAVRLGPSRCTSRPPHGPTCCRSSRSCRCPLVFESHGRHDGRYAYDDPVFKRIVALLESGRCWTKLTGYRASLAGPPPYADVAPLARYSSRARRIAACGAATGRTRTSKATCPTTAICSISSARGSTTRPRSANPRRQSRRRSYGFTA
jgi:hypothetical protein